MVVVETANVASAAPVIGYRSIKNEGAEVSNARLVASGTKQEARWSDLVNSLKDRAWVAETFNDPVDDLFESLNETE
jgi:hypothetical protein